MSCRKLLPIVGLREIACSSFNGLLAQVATISTTYKKAILNN
jgi:hypothetical protein